MKKLLIIDDEKYFCEYLEHLINWQKFGFDVKSTSNPKEALETIEKENISLVLSDIKMPEISGVDILHFIKEKKLKTNFIFLSGYSDFSYAKEGIRFGAFDYLLKPITKDELALSIKRYNEFQESIQKENIGTEDIFMKLIKYAYQEDGELLKKYPYLKELGKQIAFIQNEEKKDQFDLKIGKKYFGIVSNLNEIKKENSSSQFFSLNNSLELRRNLFRVFTGKVIKDEEFQVLEKKLPYEYFQKIWKHFAPLEVQQDQNEEVIKYLAFNFLLLEAEKTDFKLEKMSILSSKKTSQDFLQKFSQKVSGDNLNQYTIKIVEEYIQSNLEKDLSLENISSAVYLNPTYLSKLYKKQTGKNLSNFIVEKRLEKAKELLLNSKLLISDIGKLSGFNTSQYFIRVFKEAYQITPQQYRRMQYM